MRDAWLRRALVFSGVWNILGGIGALVNPAQHFQQLYTLTLDLDDPLQAFFFRGFWLCVAAWGVGYLAAAWLPHARRPILIAGGVGKLAFAGGAISLYQEGFGTGLLLSLGVTDLVFAALFAFALLRPSTPEEAKP